MPVSAQSRNLLLTTIAGAVMAIASPFGPAPAAAQDALGDGRGNSQRQYRDPGNALGKGDALGQGDFLDANTQVGRGRSNGPGYVGPRNFDFRARNYIVTDSVAGGRGFRGDVGYYASGDFAGRLGSDDSKGFRSYSALSDLLYISSPQQLDAYNIAQGTGVFEFRRDFTTLPELTNIYQARGLDDAKIRLDRSNQALTSGSLYATSVAPNNVGIVNMGEEQMRVTASPLEGIGTRKLGVDPLDDLSFYERATMREMFGRDQSSIMEFAPSQFVSDFDSAQMDSEKDEDAQIPDERISAQVTGAGPTSEEYQQIMDRVLENYANRTDVRIDAPNRSDRMRDAGRELGRLEAQINGVAIKDPFTRSEERDIRNTNDTYTGLPGSRTMNTEEPGEDEDEEEKDGMLPGEEDASSGEEGAELDPSTKAPNLSIEDMAQILQHRTRITELSSLDKSRLNRALTEGEKALSEGRFFKAERRFEQAMSINPGNPLIEMARGNAQIGAGLYLSASLTLRRVFVDNPEVIDARFRPGLLPNRTRLEFAVVAIRKRLEKDLDLEGYGMILAYIGHQTDQPELVSEGLAYVKGGARWDDFGALLRGIWLDGADTDEPLVDQITPVEDPESNSSEGSDG